MESVDGILRAVIPDRRRFYERFLVEYTAIRKAEGRGSSDPAYYLALPYRDLRGRHPDQWAIRGKTYRYFEERVLPGLESGRPLDVLDLGAGTGWMSYRLAQRQHHPVAVDITTDPLDGLGAARHFHARLDERFPLVEAEFERLPFADAQFDLAIFNSSIHHSAQYDRTGRARDVACVNRASGDPGLADLRNSPRRPDAGGTPSTFETRYGARFRCRRALNFCTRLEEFSDSLRLSWKIWPWYSWKWALRPWKARLEGSSLNPSSGSSSPPGSVTSFSPSPPRQLADFPLSILALSAVIRYRGLRDRRAATWIKPVGFLQR
jgi:SAM-dependent methyltransferase